MKCLQSASAAAQCQCPRPTGLVLNTEPKHVKNATSCPCTMTDKVEYFANQVCKMTGIRHNAVFLTT